MVVQFKCTLFNNYSDKSKITNRIFKYVRMQCTYIYVLVSRAALKIISSNYTLLLVHYRLDAF